MQRFVEMGPYPSEEIFAAFIFAERKCDALTTPLPDNGHTPYARVTEAKQACATSFVWRP